VKVLFGYIYNLSTLEFAKDYLVRCFLLTRIQNQESIEETNKVDVLLTIVSMINLRIAPLDSFFGLDWVDDLINFMGSHK